MTDILILGLSLADIGYAENKLMALSGKEGVDRWDPDDINDPADTGYQIDSTARDTILNPLVADNDLRILVTEIASAPPDQPSSSTYTVLQPSNMKITDWSRAIAKKVTLQYNGANVATNLHGLVQVGNTAYMGDLDSHKIFRLGVKELDGLNNEAHELCNAPFDLDTVEELGGYLVNAKGQSLIALANSNGTVVYLYALYVVYDATLAEWGYSLLVRLIVNPANGSLSFDTFTTVGKNAQEMWAVFKGTADEDVLLVVPAIGGKQQNGATNGTDSNMTAVPAFGTWPAPTPQKAMAAPALFTGDPPVSPTDPVGPPEPAKDLRCAAASTRASLEAKVFIMAAGFTQDNRGADYRIYRATAEDIFDLYNKAILPTPPPTPTISGLVENDTFEVVREGRAYSSAEPLAAYGVYFLGLLFENADYPGGERLLQFLGSALTIDNADNFGERSLTFGIGKGKGHIGDVNVNYVAQLAETIRQYYKGHSLQRGVKPTVVPLIAVSGEEEEREDE